MIARADITKAFEYVFDDAKQTDMVYDRIIYCKNAGIFILQYFNDTGLMYNTSDDTYISWYKVPIGRAFHSNIKTYDDLVNFFKELKDSLEMEKCLNV